MLNLIKKISIIVSIFLLFVGCNNLNVVEQTNTTGFTLKFPRISSYVKESIGFEKDSRALIAMDKVVLEIYKDSTLYKTVESNISGDSTDVSVTIEEGTYSLKAYIFNNCNSDTEAVLEGTSEDFTVVAGQTVDVLLKGKPVAPTEISLGVENIIDSSIFVPFSVNGSTQQLIDHGSEMWFSFTSTSELTEIVASGVFNNPAEFYTFLLFDSNGTYIRNINAGSIFETVPNSLYYISLIYTEYLNYSSSTILSPNFTLNVFDSSDDGNDTLATATPLTADGIEGVYSFNKINDVDYYTFDVVADHKYSIKFTNGSNMFKTINSDTGNYVSYVYGYENEETLYSFTALNTGTYSLQLSMSDINKLASYKLTLTDSGLSDINLYVFADKKYATANTVKINVYRKELDNSYTFIKDEVFNCNLNSYSSYYSEKFTMDNIVNMSTLKFVAFLYDIDDNVLAISQSYTSISSGETSLYIYNKNPIISYTANSSNLGVVSGNLWTSETVSITDQEADNIFGVSVALSNEIKFLTKPDSSLLADTDITNNIVDKSGTFSFTPDVPGTYVMEITVSDGINSVTKEITVNSMSATEGVLSVTFE